MIPDFYKADIPQHHVDIWIDGDAVTLIEHSGFTSVRDTRLFPNLPFYFRMIYEFINEVISRERLR